MKNKHKKQMATKRKWENDPADTQEPAISKKMKKSKQALVNPVNSESNNFASAKRKNIKKKQSPLNAQQNQEVSNSKRRKKDKKGKQKVASETPPAVSASASDEFPKGKKNKKQKNKKNTDAQIANDIKLGKKFKKGKKSSSDDCTIMEHENNNTNENNTNVVKVKVKSTAPNATKFMLVNLIKKLVKKKESISLDKLKTKVIQKYCKATGNPESKELSKVYDRSLKMTYGIEINDNIVNLK
ncbi:hypothetical protein FQA39_LY05666 [Lamprigera yunnana]|nr:hypothetical protein FQA39_LY05666 [Lamprigera yunnana]